MPIIYTLTNEAQEILCVAPIERASSPRSMVGIGVGTGGGGGNIRGQAMSQASGSSHSQHSLSR